MEHIQTDNAHPTTQGACVEREGAEEKTYRNPKPENQEAIPVSCF